VTRRQLAGLLPALMSEYPGFQPWHLGGDPWLTYDEIDHLISDLKARGDARKKQAADLAAAQSRRR